MKKLLKQTVPIVAILTVFVFSVSLIIQSTRAAYILPKSGNQEKVRLEKQVSFVGNPMRLKIPKIDVDAAFEYVGVTLDGEMDIPKSPENAAWFDLGARPGEIGSAVVAGHFGWKEGIPAVFDNLNKLSKGDKIFIEDEKGAVTTFVVRETREYGDKDDASAVFGSNDGEAHLNLVTCGGVWNKAEKSYSKRLVVFADKETE